MHEQPSSSYTVADLFSIGIGPSSSHTVGPMLAALRHREHCAALGISKSISQVAVTLRGSLGATGRGHGTPNAVISGLDGAHPESCDPAKITAAWQEGRTASAQFSPQCAPVPVRVTFAPFDPHPGHANALEFRALGTAEETLLSETYLSTGGGFVEQVDSAQAKHERPSAPLPFSTFAELLAQCEQRGLSIAEVVRANTLAQGSDPEALTQRVWAAMRLCIHHGMHAEPGVLPGGLKVRRRAPALAARARVDSSWSGEVSRIQADALAVNEENAAGGRVVTAPTNGAAGIIPAVIAHHVRGNGEAAVSDMLLTATAIGAIIKSHASISGAQVGCQGEVGSACAMAAAALCAATGGTPAEVGRAAEIGLEHHLGLTCDPVNGLVQVPCIERNAIAAVTAVQAATLATTEPDHHPVVTLDTVILTMRRVGADMMDKYKETSLGGLAISVTEC